MSKEIKNFYLKNKDGSFSGSFQDELGDIISEGRELSDYNSSYVMPIHEVKARVIQLIKDFCPPSSRCHKDGWNDYRNALIEMMEKR